MKSYRMSRSSLTINNIWKARGRRPTLRRTCKVFIPSDLRQLDMLRVPASYEEDGLIVQKLKALTKRKLHHWVLIISISVYLYAGAVMFQYIESNYGHIKPFNLSRTRERFLETIARETYVENPDEWKRKSRRELLAYEAGIVEAAKDGYTTDVPNGLKPHWSLQQSLLFCLIVITTIGYGNVTPSTNAGRAATIVYAFLGIPLMLMVLADLGKLFTKAIKYVFRYLRRFYKLGTFSKSKADAITHSKKPLQYMTVSWRTVSPASISGVNVPKEDDFNQVTTLTLHNDDLYKDLDFMNADEPDHKHVEVDDEFNLPVSLAIAMVLLYMVVGALLFTIWEKWTFFESFYFVFISMSTVGFGDYVPSNQTYMMGAFAYLVLGLTLTSMCINVIQEKLSATFQKAKVRIGNTIGLDVNTLLRDEAKKSRQKKLEQPKLRNGVNEKRASLPNNSIPTVVASRFESRMSTNESPDNMNNNRKDSLLTVPSQHRFKFYDSPYSTIQNESVYNTVSSMSSLRTPYQINQQA